MKGIFSVQQLWDEHFVLNRQSTEINCVSHDNQFMISIFSIAFSLSFRWMNFHTLNNYRTPIIIIAREQLSLIKMPTEHQQQQLSENICRKFIKVQSVRNHSPSIKINAI